MDGRIDLMLGCQIGANMGDLVRMVNMTFLQNDQGQLELVEREAVAAWADPGSTLGFGGLDIDDDGLQTVIVDIEATESQRGARIGPSGNCFSLNQFQLPLIVLKEGHVHHPNQIAHVGADLTA